MNALNCRNSVPTGTCIQRLAAGRQAAGVLCSVCTCRFMAALDGIDGPLEWHERFRRRAVGGGS